MERRQQESEARHDEVTNKLPEATRPLLRQIEGMQRTAAAHAQAWQAAQQRLQSRLQEAEAWAASAGASLAWAHRARQSRTQWIGSDQECILASRKSSVLKTVLL